MKARWPFLRKPASRDARWRVCRGCRGVGDVQWFGGPTCWCCGRTASEWVEAPRVIDGAMLVTRPEGVRV